MDHDGRIAGLLARAARLPRWLVFLGVLALVLLALFTDGALSAIALLGLAAVLVVLAAVSWPALTSPARALRVVVITAFVVVAASRVG